MITIKTYYIEKMDKHKIFGKNVEIQNDEIKVYYKIEKEKNLNKIIKKFLKLEINNVILDKTLWKSEKLINLLYANNINLIDGKWLKKYMTIDILNFVITQKNIRKEETEIAITVNEITELSIEIIKILSKQYKKLVVITNHIEKLRKIEKEIFEKEGILIVV